MKTTHRAARWIQRSLTETTQLAAAGTLLLAVAQASSQNGGYNPIKPMPGGIDPRPYITSITESNGFRIEWSGLQGPYQVQLNTNLNGTNWSNVGAPISGYSATVPKLAGKSFHRVSGGRPNYLGVGVGNCADCHGGRVNEWSATRHANAFQTLKNIGQQANPECVVCHTVGAMAPGGFVSEAATPEFINVQCENCHGPAGNHVGSGDPPTVFPIKTRSPMVCGGCHNGFHHPTYDEWTSSPHSAVIDVLASRFSSGVRSNEVSNMNTCGACHSGAVRLAMLAAYKTSNRTNVAWPTGFQATNEPIACIVCHESHRVNTYTNVLTRVAYTNQLRHPLVSTNVFSYNTALPFASNYNANVSVCGQCHNARGAAVSSTSRPPHHSPQYNMLLGVIGVTTNATPPQGRHKDNPRQCAGCHTHRHNETNPDPANPAFTGHTFRPSIEACSACHTNSTGATSPTNLLYATQAEISGLISTTKNLLDTWATTKNTNSWAHTYEAYGWEYTSPGQLSNPSGSTTVVGPNATEQGQIPQGIKDARFNLYLVAHDQSLGIHNAPYTRYLLQVAQQKVNALLAP